MGFIISYLPAQAEVKEDIKPLLEKIEKAGGLKEHPDANALIIFEKSWVEFEENGDFIKKEHSLVKILTEKGKKMFATNKIFYHQRYMNVDVLKARVINQDGTTVDVPQDAIKDGTLEEVQQMKIFEENFRRKSITFPSLDVGDSIETLVETRTKALLRDNYNEEFYFQFLEPYLEKEVEIIGPKSRPLYHTVKNGNLDFTHEEKENKKIYRWRAENVPKIIQELGMVSFTDVGLKLIVSTFKDWASLSRYGDRLNVGKVDTNQALKDKVAELTKGLETEKEKILAIFRYISQKVRYMGSSMDVGAFIEPHKATYTFERQFGVCRDKSILMIAMLKEIGVDCYDVGINVSRKIEPEVPSIFLEHAVCGVILKNGEIVYMDPTLELSSGFGETYVGDRYVLHLSEEGKDLIKLPSVPAEKSMGCIKAETQILADGSVSSKVRINAEGFYDFVLRSIARQAQGFQFAMLWQQLAQSLSPGTQVLNPKCTDSSNLAKPFEITFDYKTKDYLLDVDKYQMFKVPLSTTAFDVYYSNVIKNLAGLKERKYPLFLFSSGGCWQDETISVPENFKIKAVPDSFEIKEGPISLKIDTSFEGQKITFKSDFRIEKSVLSPEEYQMLKKVVKRLKKCQKSMVILEKTNH